jgi:hypothetical protein
MYQVPLARSQRRVCLTIKPHNYWSIQFLEIFSIPKGEYAKYKDLFLLVIYISCYQCGYLGATTINGPLFVLYLNCTSVIRAYRQLTFVIPMYSTAETG